MNTVWNWFKSLFVPDQQIISEAALETILGHVSENCQMFMESARDTGPQSFTKSGFNVKVTLRTSANFGEMKIGTLMVWILNKSNKLLYMEPFKSV